MVDQVLAATAVVNASQAQGLSPEATRSFLDSLVVALDELAAQATWDAQAASASLLSRISALSLLWRTYQVLASNFEQASAQAIGAIARLEADLVINEQVADELIQPFTDVLGEMYVDVMAVQPE